MVDLTQPGAFDDMNLCEMVLESYRGKGISHKKLAKLTGVGVSTINRRKYEESAVTGTARTLYKMILLGQAHGLGEKMHEVLEDIPNDEREEARCLIELTLLFTSTGKSFIVKLATGKPLSEQDLLEEEEGLVSRPDDYIQLLERSGEVFRRRAKKSSPIVSLHWNSVASSLTKTVLDAKQAIEAERKEQETLTEDEPKEPST